MACRCDKWLRLNTASFSLCSRTLWWFSSLPQEACGWISSLPVSFSGSEIPTCKAWILSCLVIGQAFLVKRLLLPARTSQNKCSGIAGTDVHSLCPEVLDWALSLRALSGSKSLLALSILSSGPVLRAPPMIEFSGRDAAWKWSQGKNWLVGRMISRIQVQFSSVAQSCLTLCDPMNCGTPGLTVHYQLLEFTQTHVHSVGDAIQSSHPLSSPSPPAFNISQHQGLFKRVSTWHQMAKVLEFSASTSVLPMKTQDWFPLGGTESSPTS